jgi:peptide/nickel transport system substrate-binding protein
MRKVARSAALAVACVTACAVVAACSSNSSGSGSKSSTPSTALGGAFGSIPAPASGAQHTGVITWAQAPNSAPNWILPLISSAADTVNDTSEFSYEMWRPLYWTQNGVEPVMVPSESLAGTPVWSDGDKTVTVPLKTSYKWSDGTPFSSADVVFTFDEIKAAIKENAGNWGPYSPGSGIPDQVASVTAPNASTVVFNLKTAANPGWFLDNYLSAVVPMPAHAWAKASASGPLLNYAIPANAAKIYNYLAAASGQESSYATNPLWQVVDGPYTLSAFDSGTGAFTLTPNNSYDGPHVAHMSVVEGIPYTSETAEFDAIRSGSVDVGYLPLDDIKQVGLVKADGYNVFGYPSFGFFYVAYNFDDKTGDFDNIISQLYFRQAMAHLENEQGYIKAFMGGAGGQAYGPVPAVPVSPYTPSDAMTDPYPFSVADAITLLKDHGWTVSTTGTDVCANAGSGPDECGAGIPAGTKLEFNLYYYAGSGLITNEVTDLASEAAAAGITIQLKSSNYNYIITYYDNPTSTGVPYINKWAMEDFGGFTDSTYPTTQGIFNTAGAENEGSYSNAEANNLINASVNGGNPNAVKAEASYLTQQQPGLFQPDNDIVVVWKKDLSGAQQSFANETEEYLTPEFWYLTG